MRVLCRHGHFAFYPENVDDVFRFARVMKVALVREQDYFTFEGLADLPRWSQVAFPFGLLPATATYEGRHAWEIMRENGFVYSLATGLLVPVAGVTELVTLPGTLDAWVSPKPLLQPGCILTGGDKLVGYEGKLDLSLQKLYLYDLETLL